MKTLLAGLVLAGVATSALAVPPTHPQPLLGEAQSAGIVQHNADIHLAENGFERTPLGDESAVMTHDGSPLDRRVAEDGFDLTPQRERVADDGFDRTPLGQLLAEDGSDRTGLGAS